MRTIFSENISSQDFISLKEITADFDNRGELLFNGRNTVKSFCLDNDKTVIGKRFKKLNLLKRLLSRKSKAIKAFENAGSLIRFGFQTPRALLAIVREPEGQDMIFTEEDKGRPLVEFLEDSDVAERLALFAFQLHETGILHRDFNNTNIRVQPDGTFSLIDINRMSFSRKPISLKKGLANLHRFCDPTDFYKCVLRKYLSLRGHTDERTFAEALADKRHHDRAYIRRKRILHTLFPH